MTAVVASLAFFVAGYFLGSSRRGGEVRKGGVESREAEFGHLRETVRARHRAQGETVDTQGMDELLSLDAVASDETKRSKRSRLLSDLNAWGWAELKRPVVVREKDDEDRRRTLLPGRTLQASCLAEVITQAPAKGILPRDTMLNQAARCLRLDTSKSIDTPTRYRP